MYICIFMKYTQTQDQHILLSSIQNTHSLLRDTDNNNKNIIGAHPDCPSVNAARAELRRKKHREYKYTQGKISLKEGDHKDKRA